MLRLPRLATDVLLLSSRCKAGSGGTSDTAALAVPAVGSFAVDLKAGRWAQELTVMSSCRGLPMVTLLSLQHVHLVEIVAVRQQMVHQRRRNGRQTSPLQACLFSWVGHSEFESEHALVLLSSQ